MARLFKRNPKGPWWADFNDAQGRRRRINLHVVEKRVATEILNDKLAKVARREHLGVIDDSAISFADFAAQWLQRIEHTIKPRSRERWCGILESHLKPAFAGSLRAISVGQVEAYRAQRAREGAAPATINREVGVLKHMTARAVAWEMLAADPLAGRKIRALREPKGRVRYLLPDEIARLLEACGTIGAGASFGGAYLRSFVLVAINTGLRRNELLGLTRRQVDWARRTARLEQTKSGEPRTVHLNATAIDALRSSITPL